MARSRRSSLALSAYRARTSAAIGRHGRYLVIRKGSYLESRAQAGDDLVQPPDGSSPMPPIGIGAKTVANLRKAWLGEATK